MSFKRASLDLNDPDVKSALAGMRPSSRLRAVAEAAGSRAVRQGGHTGGPCPAVCLATLTGWSYDAAFRHLSSFGFNGAGLNVVAIKRAYDAVFGEGRLIKPPNLTVRLAAQGYMHGKSGAICNAKHIMPVLNGRVLNADFGGHLERQATEILIYPIDA